MAAALLQAHDEAQAAGDEDTAAAAAAALEMHMETAPVWEDDEEEEEVGLLRSGSLHRIGEWSCGCFSVGEGGREWGQREGNGGGGSFCLMWTRQTGGLVTKGIKGMAWDPFGLLVDMRMLVSHCICEHVWVLTPCRLGPLPLKWPPHRQTVLLQA